MKLPYAGYKIVTTKRVAGSTLREAGLMKIRYSPDADVIIIQLRDGKIVDSIDLAEGIILHLSARKRPLEIEILDASKVTKLKEIILEQIGSSMAP